MRGRWEKTGGGGGNVMDLLAAVTRTARFIQQLHTTLCLTRSVRAFQDFLKKAQTPSAI